MAVSDDAIYAAATALAVAILKEDCQADPELRKTLLSDYAASLQSNLYGKLRSNVAVYQSGR